jgi:phosphoglycerol transferase MdoB-like AlkP superfamily enzyme
MKNSKETLLYYLIITVALIIILNSFYYNAIYPKVSPIAMNIGDAAILMSIYWLNPRRMRGATTVLFIILSLFLYANVLYTRYWGDIIPFSIIFSKASYNSMVFKSIPSLIWKRDIIYLLFVVGAILLWYKNRKKPNFETTILTRIIAIATTITLYIGCMLLTTHQIDHDKIKFDMLTKLYSTSALFKKRFEIQLQGVTIYLLSNTTRCILPNTIQLNKYERLRIAKFTQTRIQVGNDLRLDGNQHKSLIFIIVESMNAAYIGKVIDGKNITPVISSLLTQSGTIYALNVRPQIIAGGSSDGQFIYNTGLLPISDDCTAWRYYNRTFPSLAKALNKQQSIEIIADEVSVWNHAATSKAYGYDEIFDRSNIINTGIQMDQVGGDAALFTYTLNKLKKIKRPFFTELTTISMHFPFNNAQAQFSNFITAEAMLDERERRYCESLHYFDVQLGRFLAGLATAGIADNTVVVLASDHAQFTKKGEIPPNVLNCQSIAFIAINTGTTMHVDRPIRQADIYPTILDIMGVTSNGWRGVGHSIFEQNPPDDEQLQFELSDKIIRSDYFHTISAK